MSIDVSQLHLWMTYAIVLVAVISYALDRFSLEMTSIGVLAVFLAFFHIFPLNDAAGENVLSASILLQGFADPALIAIVALLVVGQGLIQTGALDKPVRTLIGWGGGRSHVILIPVLITVMLISAFLNNTPVVVIFIPVMAAMAERLGISASRVMMPLSLVAILGGMTTLIGSSTNLLVAGTVRALGAGEINFFDFSVPGMLLAGVGFLYVWLVVPRLLPSRGAPEGVTEGSGKHYISQLDVHAGNPLIGQRPVAGMFQSLPGMTVRSIRRGRDLILPPFDALELKEGDTVNIAATRKALSDLFSRNPQIVGNSFDLPATSVGTDGDTIPGGDRMLVETVIAPASRMEGRTIAQAGFRTQTNCVVFGIQRRSRMYRSGLDDIRLEAGDVLLVVGRRKDIHGLRANRDILLLEWSAEELPVVTHVVTAISIFTGVVVVAAFDILPITITALIGAGLMIATGCLNIRQASRAVDRRIVLIVAAALAMGTALEATGGASYLAHMLSVGLAGAPPAVLLSGYFLLVTLMTNLLTNNATAVLFTPIGLNLGAETGIDPMVFVYTTIFAANCSFATPMSYQTNLLVMGPGQYRFADYMRAGTPLVVLLWLVYSFFAPWYYNLG